MPHHFILETKGWNLQRDLKKAAGQRWMEAVNTDGRYGHWQYVGQPKDVKPLMDEAWDNLGSG